MKERLGGDLAAEGFAPERCYLGNVNTARDSRATLVGANARALDPGIAPERCHLGDVNTARDSKATLVGVAVLFFF